VFALSGRLTSLASLYVLTLALAVIPGGPAEALSGASPAGRPSVGLRLVAEGLTSPVAVVPANDGSRRLFVVDQVGLIHILRSDGTLAPEPFLDVRDRMVTLMPDFDERGLLGLAFHPDYAKNGRFFVYYSAALREGGPEGFNHTARISEFRVSVTDPDRAELDSERIVLSVDEPQFNHNGGTILFGPRDGYLYIALGDGGAANDLGLGHVEDWYPDNGGGNGQDVTANLLGSILRIDVDRGDPYGIPAGNPFVGKAGLDEIFAYGFRNPYRMSFDSRWPHHLFVGDVGQNAWEEVSIVRRGGNYGWNVKEGTHCFDAEAPDTSPAECPDIDPEGDPLIDPVIEYGNPGTQPDGLGVAAVGGHVYHGRELRQLRGRYVFGDWSTSFDQPDGSLFVATPRRGLWRLDQLHVSTTSNGRLGHFVLGFGEDRRGEIYVGTRDNPGPTGQTGRVYRLVAPDRR
jgi:glucose/arabinose dehydrogenase